MFSPRENTPVSNGLSPRLCVVQNRQKLHQNALVTTASSEGTMKRPQLQLHLGVPSLSARTSTYLLLLI